MIVGSGARSCQPPQRHPTNPAVPDCSLRIGVELISGLAGRRLALVVAMGYELARQDCCGFSGRGGVGSARFPGRCCGGAESGRGGLVGGGAGWHGRGRRCGSGGLAVGVGAARVAAAVAGGGPGLGRGAAGGGVGGDCGAGREQWPGGGDLDGAAGRGLGSGRPRWP
jgi:hypothetical protein